MWRFGGDWVCFAKHGGGGGGLGLGYENGFVWCWRVPGFEAVELLDGAAVVALGPGRIAISLSWRFQE